MLTVIAKGEQRLLHASSLIALAAYAAQLRFLDKPSGKAERSESNDTCINSCVPSCVPFLLWQANKFERVASVTRRDAERGGKRPKVERLSVSSHSRPLVAYP